MLLAGGLLQKPHIKDLAAEPGRKRCPSFIGRKVPGSGELQGPSVGGLLMSSVKSQRVFWVREEGGESGCCCCGGFAGRRSPVGREGPGTSQPRVSFCLRPCDSCKPLAISRVTVVLICAVSSSQVAFPFCSNLVNSPSLPGTCLHLASSSSRKPTLTPPSPAVHRGLAQLLWTFCVNVVVLCPAPSTRSLPSTTKGTSRAGQSLM